MNHPRWFCAVAQRLTFGLAFLMAAATLGTGAALEPAEQSFESAYEPTYVAPEISLDDEAPPEGEVDFSGEDSVYWESAAELAPCSGTPCNCPGTPCNCPACTAAARKKQEALQKAVASAYAPVFYNNKFDYLNDPAYEGWFLGDQLKQLQPGCCWTVDLGGQYRMRYQGERNFRGLGLTGVDDDFLLHRTRLFANARYGDRFRIYVEGIDAESNYENFAPRAIEVNRTDLQNLFADLVVWECDERSLTGRVGRQELLYGNQRLISPLDWANTRRTFEGVNAIYRGAEWNTDLFFVQPVAVDPHNFDRAIDEQEFFGAYATYKKHPNHAVDFYALQYNNDSAPLNYQYTTLGTRWTGSDENWLWELEGGYQFGDNTDDSSHAAGFWTAGTGRKFDHCWKPVVWVYYDWASGDNSRGAGNGFNHLFPLGHKYLGYMDLFARSNIESPNVQLTFQPHEKVTVVAWYYYFFLENGLDSPYNVNMAPFRPGNAAPSRDLGHEIDLTLTYAWNARTEILLGYSHFFAGKYFERSPLAPAVPPGAPGVPFQGDADFFYAHFQRNF